MAVAEVPERKRFCPACGAEVGRSRDGVPGRTAGFCPKCGNHVRLHAVAEPGRPGRRPVRGRRLPRARWPGLDLPGARPQRLGPLGGAQGPAQLRGPGRVRGGDLGAAVPRRGRAPADRRDLQLRHARGRRLHRHGVRRRTLAQADPAGPPGRGTAASNTPLPVDQALAFVLEILPAFAYLHDVGLLFCDFKPDNVIQQGDAVKLIDLGGVRRIDDLDSAIFGTVGYQAPEVAEVGPSVASDIYTIGRTLATLVLDFRGNTSTYVASLPAGRGHPGVPDVRLVLPAAGQGVRARPVGPVRHGRRAARAGARACCARSSRPTAGPGSPALHSAASVLFEAPTSDEAGHPLAWDQLPALKVDASDPAASWLAGVNVSDPHAAHRGPGRRAAGDRRGAAAADHARRSRRATQRARRPHDRRRSSRTTRGSGGPPGWAGSPQLSTGDPVAARASFNAVYGQVPGELAPKLALATACELSGEPDIAESLYIICARSDANYTAPAAFGLARIRPRARRPARRARGARPGRPPRAAPTSTPG